jgi:hypothetical protein
MGSLLTHLLFFFGKVVGESNLLDAASVEKDEQAPVKCRVCQCLKLTR